MTQLYNVDLDCPRCGQLHWVRGGPGCGVLIEHGPDRAGTLAELYEGRELPGVPVRLVTDTPWCDEVQGHVPMEDPNAGLSDAEGWDLSRLQNPMTCATI